jgi:hypothetical protein
MYDFDETLCTKNMQEYSLLDNIGISAADFWGSVVKTAKECNMDPTLTYMYLLVKQAEKQGIMLRRENFQALGRNIEYYPGVESFFKRINEYGASLGAEIHHFIISSGNKEILEGCSIYDEFTKVFASEFHYDHNGNADWPAVSINYTGKTQFLFRINLKPINQILSVICGNTLKAADLWLCKLIYGGSHEKNCKFNFCTLNLSCLYILC